MWEKITETQDVCNVCEVQIQLPTRYHVRFHHPRLFRFSAWVYIELGFTCGYASRWGQIQSFMSETWAILVQTWFISQVEFWSVYSAFQWNAESCWTWMVFIVPQSATVLHHRKVKINMTSMRLWVWLQHTIFFKITKKHVYITIKIY